MPTPKRPKRILYGFYSAQESLCFFDEVFVRNFDAEVSAVKACATVREAIQLNQELKLTYVPGIPQDEEELEDEGLTLESHYDWSETGAVQDGDWPPMPTALSLRTFEDDDREAWDLIFSDEVGGSMATTVINGDYLEIPQGNEAALLAAFDRLGIPYVRDERVVENLGM